MLEDVCPPFLLGMLFRAPIVGPLFVALMRNTAPSSGLGTASFRGLYMRCLARWSLNPAFEVLLLADLVACLEWRVLCAEEGDLGCDASCLADDVHYVGQWGCRQAAFQGPLGLDRAFQEFDRLHRMCLIYPGSISDAEPTLPTST